MACGLPAPAQPQLRPRRLRALLCSRASPAAPQIPGGGSRGRLPCSAHFASPTFAPCASPPGPRRGRGRGRQRLARLARGRPALPRGGPGRAQRRRRSRQEGGEMSGRLLRFLLARLPPGRLPGGGAGCWGGIRGAHTHRHTHTHTHTRTAPSFCLPPAGPVPTSPPGADKAAGSGPGAKGTRGDGTGMGRDGDGMEMGRGGRPPPLRHGSPRGGRRQLPPCGTPPRGRGGSEGGTCGACKPHASSPPLLLPAGLRRPLCALQTARPRLPPARERTGGGCSGTPGRCPPGAVPSRAAGRDLL